MINILNSLVVLLPILLSVAFITLIERKLIAYIQRRVGPNSVGILGLLQPFSDALKLLTKENLIPSHSLKWLFLLSPIISLTFSLLGWLLIPFNSGIELLDRNNSIILTLAFSSLGIYGILLSGWSANSSYSLIGSLRSTAQILSYELILGSSVLIVVLITNSWNYNDLNNYQTLWYLFPLIPIFFSCFFSILAELQRAPIDLSEAESELVAGFFTEHSSVPFVIFFLAEYCSLVLISCFIVFLFFGGSFVLGLKTSLITLIIVWIRATLPRLRYDTLIEICWIDILPFIIACLLFIPSVFIAFI